MISGVVKWFRDDKGYGFIIGNDSQEYFVHYKKVHNRNEEGRRTLTKDQVVQFEPRNGERGLEALEVKVVNNEPK